MSDSLSTALAWRTRAARLRRIKAEQEPPNSSNSRAAKPWRQIARPNQLAPGTPGAADHRRDWTYWLLCAGRGFGKTRSGAEWACEQARTQPGSHGALVAATADDARKTMLSAGLEAVEGASGILAVAAPGFRPTYEPSKRLVSWPNGSRATLYSAEEPNRLRGPQHHWAWVDEIAAWEREAGAWDQLLFGLRLGTRPRACITTTPRPIKLVRDLLRDPLCVVTRGATRDNARNLAPGFLRQVVAKYEGTRLGRQELDAEVLDDVEGALWTLAMIESGRVRACPELQRIVVAIDPAVTAEEGSDETGIVAAGVGLCGCRGTPELHGFVLDDVSGKHTPDAWARAALRLYTDLAADRVIAEVNNGGDLVEANLRTVDRAVPYTAIHASRGKRTRAEPVAALYEQGKVHHVGTLPKLEDQLCTWEPLTGQRSPDRLDALVWCLTDMMILGEQTTAELWDDVSLL